MGLRFAIFTAGLALSIAGCGSVKLPSLTTGSVNTQKAPPPDDPVARGVEVGVVSAQAQKCGYYFDPQQLRTNFLAAEAQRAASPEILRKVEVAHDYSRLRITKQIADLDGYCAPGRTEKIKAALTRFLAGDFSVSKRKKTPEAGLLAGFSQEQKREKFDPGAIHDPLLNDKKKNY